MTTIHEPQYVPDASEHRIGKHRSVCIGRGVLAGIGLVVLATGCHNLDAPLPAGIQDPSVFNTAKGALEKRNAADSIFTSALLTYSVETGLISDELDDAGTGGSLFTQTSITNNLDERILPQFSSNGRDGSDSYGILQSLRGSTNEAIGALAKYDTADAAVRGEMYAMQGYAEVMLAELFCSGVPLSTYDFEEDFTYKPGSTQQQVYQDALAKFDSALALSIDSAHILNFARVGAGRAYLDLGDYTHAAAAVAAVSDDYHEERYVRWGDRNGNRLNSAANISNREGTNGLPFITSGDPRTRDTVTFVTNVGLQMYFPLKYASAFDGAPYSSPLTIASGIEARLIQAEAALQRNDPNWLTILNTLRTAGGITVDTVADTLGVTDCNVPGQPICGDQKGFDGNTPEFGQPVGGFVPPSGFIYAGTDTTTPLPPGIGGTGGICYNYSWYAPCYNDNLLVVQYYTQPRANPVWSAGTGGVGGLAPLTDPGAGLSGTAAMNARVDLLFQERAYWLYVTGHRQGDLRRLIRQYHRDQSTVYPTGAYLAPGRGVYGSDVTVPIPSSETPNPYFHGCLDRNA